MTDISPQVAVACSGLGHVHRGIESWALDVATGLRRSCVAVTLFGGRAAPSVEPLGCLPRAGPAAIRLAQSFRHLGGWRYGMGSAYEIEQASFAWNLWRRIRSTHDILHVQDPLVAMLLEAAHRSGLSRARVLYANGTGEPAAVMRRFANLQLLTPQAAADWEPQRPATQKRFMVPNFVDTDRFVPGDRAAARAGLGLPPEATILLCCAAIRRVHKRVDWLVQAFAAARRPGDGTMLVVAGGREPDSDTIIAEGRALLGDAVRFMVDVPRQDLLTLYQAADVFVLPSLSEMFGIVLVEALACGLPVLCHDTPDFRYVVGPAGLYRDLSQCGSFAAALAEMLTDRRYATLAGAARPHAVSQFSEPVVIRQIIEMYRGTMQGAA